MSYKHRLACFTLPYVPILWVGAIAQGQVSVGPPDGSLDAEAIQVLNLHGETVATCNDDIPDHFNEQGSKGVACFQLDERTDLAPPGPDGFRDAGLRATPRDSLQ